MLHAYPPFYKPFRCTASACPDNCCVGWEVVVDDDTAKLYSSIPGSLGDALRGAMTVDADGDRIIAMTDGHCPFWTQDHLCRVELELGHDAPCATCRKFPRLTQDYGVFTEYGLTLACPWPAPKPPDWCSPNPAPGPSKPRARPATQRRRNSTGTPWQT